eukprot:TRINITY_DN49103_c0_g1_i1.p1 TRINITY_DN49103_c0_g1~~TRINITY_DN49103_c0_g1_i1.p1  ORF type:complete len:149 (+),score=39.33 TRINITY_DN49103_c0_g1_i1:23-469(+)
MALQHVEFSEGLAEESADPLGTSSCQVRQSTRFVSAADIEALGEVRLDSAVVVGEAASEPPAHARSVKGRSSTAYVAMSDLPDDEVDVTFDSAVQTGDAAATAAGVRKDLKNRQKTGFISQEQMDLLDEDDAEEVAGRQGLSYPAVNS